MIDCLSQRDMAAFVEGTASADELGTWKRHLRVCDRCASAMARFRAGLEPEPKGGQSETRSTKLETSPNGESPKLETARPPGDSVPALGGSDLSGNSGLGLRISGLEPNLQIGDFRIERRLGCGGMGVVYQALQLSLNRRVALKVLPFGLAAGPSGVERFHREARAAAKLRHPNIITIYAEGAERNACYFAMEMIDGQNLDRIIAEFRREKVLKAGLTLPSVEGESEIATEAEPGIRPDDATATPSVLQTCKSDREYFNTVARLIAEVADALNYAHGQGIIHRDVKPSNLMLSRDGRLILLDFGIARICEERAMTVTGSFVGTPRYMSPEQIAGGQEKPDHRCDVYSLGVTLYELLTLEPPFDGDTQQQVLGQVLNKEARRPRHVNRHIPVDLDTICCKAMEKDASRRYQNAGEMAEDLRRYLGGRVIKARSPRLTDGLVKLVRRRKATVTLAAGIVIISVVAALIAWEHYTTRWAQQYAMAEIDRLMAQDEYFPAFILAEKAERYIPDDPLLTDRWPRLARRYVITTKPSRARVYIRQYANTTAGWKYLGRSPLYDVRVPFGTYRWRVKKPGFMTIETVQPNDPPLAHVDRASLPSQELTFTLHENGSFPADMVWIPSSDLSQRKMFHGERDIPAAPEFLIDKYETTNRQYKEFVAGGGYEKQDFWREPFVREGKVLSWSQAMQVFQDQTGYHGPASWRNGTYPEDQSDYPVGGISWYEAAAYAQSQGKDLPTIFHWARAARADDVPSRITDLSNFSDSLAPVGSYRGMGKFGLYDAAGNVREWCYNALVGDDSVRCILGGAWNEHTYVFAGEAARSPWDRDPRNGVRCIRYPGGRESVPEIAFAPVEHKHRDFASFTPVPDDVFKSYVDTWYRYDRTDLKAKIEAIDRELPYCRRERITFDAAYPNERVIAYLHVPNGVEPPYQTVVWFPGGGAREQPWPGKAYSHELVCIIESGRALVIPFYKGTYERRFPDRLDYPPDGILSRNVYVQRSQDMRRTIDYLQTRGDIDMDKLAFVGLSWGAQVGSLMTAMEDRFRTSILLLGGICACKRDPAADPANFAPRVKIPTLMINGKEDSEFPFETAQKPLFDLLGTPAEHKRHVLLPGEHSIPWEYRKQYHKEIVGWLDKYLGPVQRDDHGR